MRDKRIESFYAIVSFALYLISLFCPVYFNRHSNTPAWTGFSLLEIGWLGVIVGYYSWLANPFYAMALVFRQSSRVKTIVFELISLLFALSFLFYSKIPHGELGGGGHSITSYDWGYCLWVLAIAVLLMSDISSYILDNSDTLLLIKHSPAIVIITVLSYFTYYHYFGKNSKYQIELRMDRVFQEGCKSAGEKVYRNPEDKVNGIFFSGSATKVYYTGIKNGYFTSRGHEDISDAKKELLRKRMIVFYETPEHIFDKIPSYRFYFVNNSGEKTKISKSEYTLTSSPVNIIGNNIEFYDIINSNKIIIIENKTKSVIAETTYVANHYDNKFCGHSVSGDFTTEGFLTRVLNISLTSQ